MTNAERSRINNLEDEIENLKRKMENYEARESLLLKDLNRLLDDTDEKPGVIRQLIEIKELLKKERGE